VTVVLQGLIITFVGNGNGNDGDDDDDDDDTGYCYGVIIAQSVPCTVAIF
jgi:hypothetical protein